MKIIVFSKENCPNCEILKGKLYEEKVLFETVRVDESLLALTWLKDRGHRSVPQVYLGEIEWVEGVEGNAHLKDLAYLGSTPSEVLKSIEKVNDEQTH